MPRETGAHWDPSLTSGMSAALMQGHCLRRRPCIKQHMSGGPEFHRKYHRQLPPHLTRHDLESSKPGCQEGAYHMTVTIIFLLFFFKMAAGGHLGFYPFKKNARNESKSTRQILKVDILGYKNQSLKSI